MCGRYTTIETEKLYPRFKTVNRLEKNQPASYNVAPGQLVPVITAQSPNHIELMKWGFVPQWAKDLKGTPKPINAKAENLGTSPMWRGSFKSHRCLVPATGFYEWKTVAGKKHPYWFYLKDQAIFSFAGLYSVWHDAKDHPMATFTIVTTRPNKVMAPIHDRMPAILAREEEKYWLADDTDPADLQAMLDPYENSDTACFEVSTEVNSPRHNDPQLIKPIAK